MQIILIRFDEPSQDKVNAIIAKLDPAFPAATFELNWLLCETLAYLQSPNTAAKGMALIAEAESQEPQMQYARSLRFLKTGWTSELRKQQLEWFLKAANYRGGASFERFISFIKQDSLATFTEAELKEHAELIAREPEQKSVIENLGEMFAGRTPKMWTLEELSAATKTGLKHRNFENGRKMFSAAACFACHRFGNAGGMNGPDLTAAAGKFNPHDLLDNILNPSKVISDQFVPIVVTMEDGDTVTGIVVNLNGDSVSINTDLTNPNQRTNIDRRKVSSIEVSDVSPMPQGLLAALTKEEILDLCAYILSGGDKTDAMFKN
jgi:putative heme-binding domain-containing protein